jgi:uncharacterized protein YbjT (DUF2867 family)
MITVMGATGRTGRKIAETLLRAGESVRCLARTQSNLAALKSTGADALAGDASDPEFLAEAFRGSDAVYTLLPTDRRSPDYRARQDQEGEAIEQALRRSGVRYVVALSSLGAELSGGTGLIAGLHAQEKRLEGLEGANVLFLRRPVSFFENFYEYIPRIKRDGFSSDSVAPDVAVPMVASRDIADAAARALAARDWQGVEVRELLGHRDLSHAEATLILGEQIGIYDLQYIQLPYADVANLLVREGLSRSFAGQYVEMTRAVNESRVKPLEGRTPRNTTPTRFEDFAPELARAYEAAS